MEELRGAMEAKCQDLNYNDLELQWSKWKDAIKETACSILGYKKGRKEEWISNQTWDLILEKKRLKMKMETSNAEMRFYYKSLHKQKAAEVKRATRRDKRAFNHQKADEAEEAESCGNQRELFKIARELGKTHKTYNGVIADAAGNRLTTEEDQNRRWKEHFQNVLNCPEPEVINTWSDIS